MLYENKLDSFFVVTENSSLQYPPHVHSYIELVQVMSGKLEMQIGSRIYTLGNGDYAVIFPNIVHNYHTLSDDAHTCLFIGNCALKLMPSYSMMLEKNSPQAPVITRNESPYQLKWIQNELLGLNTKKVSDSLIGSLFSLFIAYSLPELHIIPVDNNLNKDLSLKIISYISAHCLEDLSLDNVSKQFGIGKYTLSRIFSSVLGVSFTKYINSQRINYASFQLLNTEDDINQIAYDCGYSNQQTFNRVFKEELGQTPTAYRKAHPGLPYPPNQNGLLPKNIQDGIPSKNDGPISGNMVIR